MVLFLLGPRYEAFLDQVDRRLAVCDDGGELPHEGHLRCAEKSRELSRVARCEVDPGRRGDVGNEPRLGPTVFSDVKTDDRG